VRKNVGIIGRAFCWSTSGAKQFGGIQFALMLFLHDLMSSILSFFTGLDFFVKGLLSEKQRASYYCAIRTFYGDPSGVRRFLLKKFSCGYLL
jgi:hypothetical protein